MAAEVPRAHLSREKGKLPVLLKAGAASLLPHSSVKAVTGPGQIQGQGQPAVPLDGKVGEFLAILHLPQL